MLGPEHAAQPVGDDGPHHGHGEALEDHLRHQRQVGETWDWQPCRDVSDVLDSPHLVRLAQLQLTGDGGGEDHDEELGGQRVPAVRGR